ncbi:MAG: 4Fe-4S binding protein [Proteobacteria bacterium]|nr:4Fe-4S binding protein [Pseudomonadota bacterium]
MAVKVDHDKCVGCGACEGGCPAEAIKVNDDGKAVCDADACVGCLACIDNCPCGAIEED